MSLSRDETSLLSGSWDKTINDWDLNTGQVKRSFLGSGGQISAIEMRPISDVPIPRDFAEPQLQTSTFTTDSNDKIRSRGSISLSNGAPDGETRRPSEAGPVSPGDSLFGGGDSLFGDNDNNAVPGVGFDQDDDDNEFTRAFAGGVDQQPQAATNGDFMNGDDHDVPQDAEKATDTDANQPSEEQPAELPDFTTSLDDVFAPEGESKPKEDTPDNPPEEEQPTSETIFLDAAIDGTLRIWDRRQPTPVARMVPPRGTPPWCMNACWSHDGNFIYAGRRNGTIDEYSIHNGLHEPRRTLHFPGGSGPVSAVRAMPNSKHLIW